MLRQAEEFQRKLPNEALHVKFYPNTFNYGFWQPPISSRYPPGTEHGYLSAATGSVSSTFRVQNFLTF